MIDLRQTPEYAKYMSSIGWLVSSIGQSTFGRERKTYVYIKKFPLIGSFIKIQRPEVLRDQEIKLILELSKKYRAFQIVIEPKDKNQESITNPSIERIRNYGFKQSKSPFLPSKTIHIDLNKSEKQLLKEMHKKTRYNIKIAKKRGVEIKISKNIEKFSEFWQGCARKQRGMFLSQKKEIIELYKAFGGNAHLLLTYTKNASKSHPEFISGSEILNQVQNDKTELLSGILMIRTKDIAYYMYAASSNVGKKLFAPSLNVWESIRLARKLGCKIFDFEGIYDERFPLKSWKGFTRFKKSFGGREIVYPGAFVKYRLPF